MPTKKKLRKSKKPKQVITPVVVEIPDKNWDRLDNRQLRNYVYTNRLAFAFQEATGIHIRSASRTEIAQFLNNHEHVATGDKKVVKNNGNAIAFDKKHI